MVINDQRVLRGWEKVEFSVDGDVFLGQDVTFSVAAPECPDGKIILSGGISTGSSEVIITESYPGDDNTWHSTIYHPGPGTATLPAFASYTICVSE
jgi:hypothetical protein